MAQTFSPVDIQTGAGSSNPEGFQQYNNLLYFSATDGIHGTELWVSDGTQAGTQMVKDIWVGTGSSDVGDLTVFNNKLYFAASDSVHGRELWVTDGTDTGTHMVYDLLTGTVSSNPNHLIVYNNKLFFNANGPVVGNELFVTDGITESYLRDINPGSAGSNAGETGAVILNNLLIFSATDVTHGNELWVSDGTFGGTVLLADIWPGTGSSFPGQVGFGPPYAVLNDLAFFQAEDSLHGYQLWVTNGTTSGTQVVTNACTQPGYKGGFITFNNKVYFAANGNSDGNELWVSDSTTAGTVLVKDINPGGNSSNPDNFFVYNNQLLFAACAVGTGLSPQLFSTDGTSGGTRQLTNRSLAKNNGFNPLNMVELNGLVYFIGQDSLNGYQLFSTNGTDTNLVLLQPAIAPNNNPLSGMSGPYVFNNSLAFAANYTSIGNELWFYTPAPSAISNVSSMGTLNIYPNPTTANITVAGLQDGQNYQLTLSDLQGRQLKQFHLQGTGNPATLFMQNMATGIYLLQIDNGQFTQTRKVVKE